MGEVYQERTTVMDSKCRHQTTILAIFIFLRRNELLPTSKKATLRPQPPSRPPITRMDAGLSGGGATIVRGLYVLQSLPDHDDTGTVVGISRSS